MKKVTIIPIMFTIFTLIIFPVASSVYADQPSTSPDACQESNPGKSKAVGNKHCADSGNNTQFTSCDLDSSGSIEANELSQWAPDFYPTVDFALFQIVQIEQLVDSKGKDLNQTIDTEQELELLNTAGFSPICSK